MIAEGFKLMILGMSMVFAFLVLLYASIIIMANLFKGAVTEELAAEEKALEKQQKAQARQKVAKKIKTNSDSASQSTMSQEDSIIAAITAALSQHRAQK